MKHKNMRSILSLALCLALLLGIAPFGALYSSADTLIRNVGILDFDAPTPEGSPASSYDAPNGAGYYVNGVEWHGSFDNEGCFIEGNSYYAEIWIEADEGYTFGNEGYGTGDFDRVTINGKSELVNHDECWYYEGSFRMYSVSFICGKTQIRTVEVVNFDAPTPEGSPASSCDVPDGADYYVNGIEWHGSFDDDGCFIEGNSYFAEIWIEANEGCVFGDEGYGTGDFDRVTINDQSELVNHGECWYYKGSFRMYSVTFICGKTQIRSVEVFDFVEPEVGEHPILCDQMSVDKDAPYTIHSISWIRIGGGSVDRFEEKGKYRAGIVLVPKDGYTFGEEGSGLSRFDSVKINGKASLINEDESCVSESTLVITTRVFDLSTTIEKNRLLYEFDFTRSFADEGWLVADMDGDGKTWTQNEYFGIAELQAKYLSNDRLWSPYIEIPGTGKTTVHFSFKTTGRLDYSLAYQIAGGDAVPINIINLTSADNTDYKTVSGETPAACAGKRVRFCITATRLGQNETSYERMSVRFFSVRNKYEINKIKSVTVNNFSAPVNGQTASTAASLTLPVNAPYTVQSLFWSSSEVDRSVEGGFTFKAGVSYSAFLLLKAKPGWGFEFTGSIAMDQLDAFSFGGNEKLVRENASGVYSEEYFVINTQMVTVKDRFKIYFFSNGTHGPDMPAVTVPAGQEYTFPQSAYTLHDGEKFLYWCDLMTGKSYFAGSRRLIVDDMVLEPVFLGNSGIQTISFDPGTGTGSVSDMYLKYGESFTLSECPFTAPEGQAFNYYLIGDTRYDPGQTVTVYTETTIKVVYTSKTTIGKIRLVGIPAAIAGSGASAKKPEGTLAFGEHAVITEQAWYAPDPGSGTYHKVTGALSAGVTYTPVFTVEPAKGWSFESSVEVTLGDYTKKTLAPDADGRIFIYGTPVEAYTIYSGTVGSCSWKFDDKSKTFTVSGSGTFAEDSALRTYLYEAEHFVVTGGVTGIGDNVLYYADKLISVDLSDCELRHVGSYCFNTCPALTDLHLGYTLQTVGDNSFCDLAIKDLTLPTSLQTVGSSSFWYMLALERLNIGPMSQLRSVGERSFSELPGVSYVELPTGLTDIGEGSIGFFDESPKQFDFVIYGYSYSAAHRYAYGNGMAFDAMDGSGENGFFIYAYGERRGPFETKDDMWNSRMTKRSDGKWERSFFVKDIPGGIVYVSVAEVEYDTLSESDSAPVGVRITDIGSFTVICDPSTGEITFVGDNVDTASFTADSIYAVGQGPLGMLNDAFRAPDDERNQMTETKEGCFTITCPAVAAGECQVAFLVNGTWDDFFGYGGEVSADGCTVDATHNESAIRFTLTKPSSVELILDLLDYDEVSGTGACIRIIVTPLLQGDINNDGKVNISDVTELLTVLAGHGTSSAACDLNGDGKININDVTTLLYILAGSPA